jgi:perosamine synthetase
MMDDLPAILGGAAACTDWEVNRCNQIDFLFSVIQSGDWAKYHGEYHPQLIELLKTQFQVPHAFTCSSGTLAVELALRAVGVQAGDEVIMAGYEYEPNFHTIHHLQAHPVLVEINPYGQMDVACVADSISSKTRAILATPMHGSLLDMLRLRQIASHYQIPIIEDIAQATGARLGERMVGSFGDLATLSFGGSKLLAAGRGGAILASNSVYVPTIRRLLTRGVQSWCELSEIQAALILPQLMDLGHSTESRWKAVQELDELLRSISGLVRWKSPVELNAVPAFYKVGYWYDRSEFGLPRNLFLKSLIAEGVPMAEGFRPLPVGRSPKRFRTNGTLPNTLDASETIVKLHHVALESGRKGVEAVARAIHRIYRNAERIRREFGETAHDPDPS